MAGEGEERDEMSKRRCFHGVSTCIVAKGMSSTRLKLLSEIFRKRGGDHTSTIQSRTTHVIGSSWSNVEASFAAKPLLFERIQQKVSIVSFEWICACLQVGRLVNCEDFDLFLLEDQPSPPPRSIAADKRRKISIKVPDPAHVERVITKLQEMDERQRVKQQQLLEQNLQMSKEVSMMMEQYRLGNLQAGDTMKKRLGKECNCPEWS